MKPMTEKELLKLPEGTAIVVDGIEGVLIFNDIPKDFVEIEGRFKSFIEKNNYWLYEEGATYNKKLAESINYIIGLHAHYRENLMTISNDELPSLNDAYILDRYINTYPFGISYATKEDDNVFPRDIGKPSIKKGTLVSCYEYPADLFTIK